MARSLLVLPMFLCSALAFAAEPAPAEAEEATCPRERAEQQKAAVAETSTPAARPGTQAPVRPRGSSGAAGRGTPRWHSMLPGMVR